MSISEDINLEFIDVSSLEDSDVSSSEDSDVSSCNFADVPSSEDGAQVDPHWLELRGEGLLPSLYMPPAMSRVHSPAMRAVAIVLIAMFLLATALGVCLTYGPPTQLI